MKNQFLAVITVFLMGYFSQTVLENIRPAAQTIYNSVEALVASNHSNKKNIAKNTNKNIKLVQDNTVGIIPELFSMIIISKEENIEKNNSFDTRDEVKKSSRKFQTFKKIEIRGPTPIGNNTS